jgi:hypothetical protein
MLHHVYKEAGGLEFVGCGRTGWDEEALKERPFDYDLVQVQAGG